MINKYRFTLLFTLILITKIYAQQTTFGKISYMKATNISGKQRMLSQRIAKVFLVRKAGAHSPELSKEYNSSIQLFTRNLSILESNSKNSSSKIKASIKKEQMQWNLFKSKLQTPTSTVSEIISLSNNLLIKSNNLVLAIEEESKYNNEFNNNTSNDQLRVETINLSGKQRMLSQRLCLYYAACRLYKKEKIQEIDWVDITANELAVKETSKNSKELLRRLHVKEGEKVLEGAEAFLLLWKKIPKYKFLYNFFRLPIIFSIFSFTYEIVAFFLYLKNKKQLKN